MLNIAIVEDDPRAAGLLVSYLDRYAQERGTACNSVIFNDALDFLTGYKASFDLVFMDIELPGLDGMEAARRLREVDESVILIFVTNMANFAVKGYEVDALDFIVKPVAYFPFSVKLGRAVKRLESRQERELLVPAEDGVVCLKCSEVTYIEVMQHRITYHTRDKSYAGYGSLKKIEPLLPEKAFVRCNSCYVVNLRYVRQVKDFSVLVGEDWLTISHARRKPFLSALNEYIGSME